MLICGKIERRLKIIDSVMATIVDELATTEYMEPDVIVDKCSCLLIWAQKRRSAVEGLHKLHEKVYL